MHAGSLRMSGTSAEEEMKCVRGVVYEGGMPF